MRRCVPFLCCLLLAACHSGNALPVVSADTAAAATQASENGWTVLMRAGEQSWAARRERDSNLLDREMARSDSLSVADSGALQELIDVQGESLRTLESAVALPHWQIPIVKNSREIPRFGAVRNVLRAQVARARLRAARGEWQQAADDMLGGLLVGLKINESAPSLTHYFIGVSLQNAALGQILWLAAEAHLPAEVRQRLADVVDAAPDQVAAFAHALEAEWQEYVVPMSLADAGFGEFGAGLSYQLCDLTGRVGLKKPGNAIPKPERAAMHDIAAASFETLRQSGLDSWPAWNARLEARIAELDRSAQPDCDRLLEITCKRSPRSVRPKNRPPLSLEAQRSAVTRCAHQIWLTSPRFEAIAFWQRFNLLAAGVALAITRNESNGRVIGNLEELETGGVRRPVPNDPYCGNALQYDAAARQIHAAPLQCTAFPDAPLKRFEDSQLTVPRLRGNPT